ncbi:MAG: hypothetical protein ACRDXB_16165, partial [Actinomycetes bacterium]
MVDVPTRARHRGGRARLGRADSAAGDVVETTDDPYAAWYGDGDPEAPAAPPTSAIEVVAPAPPAPRPTRPRPTRPRPRP